MNMNKGHYIPIAFKFRQLFTVLTIALLFIIAFASGILVLLLVQRVDDLAKTQIWVEVAKSLLQLAIVLIVGGFIATLFKGNEQRRDYEKELQKTRGFFLDRLGEAYAQVKRSRRILRAVGLTKTFCNPPVIITKEQREIYGKHLEIINDMQLELEKLNLQINYFSEVFSTTDELINKINSMEDYLKELVREYERNWPLLQGEQSKIAFDNLSTLSDFTGRFNESLFRKNFCEMYVMATHLMRCDILYMTVSQSK